MPELDDQQLLAKFAGENSEAAFAAVVSRYVNLVYSAALRFTRNPDAAEEITQAVFIILARKAGSLPRGTVLSGWLYQTARFTAANVVKREIRRRRREQEDFMQSTMTNEPDSAWEQMAPLLEEAMACLGETDRNAIVLRFFENKTGREVAVALKMKEEAAHKRVNRALEKLRKFFAGRGIASTTAIIAGVISANSVHAAPAALAKSVAAVAIAKGATVSVSTLTLVKGALKVMAWTKTTTAVVGVGVLLLAGTGALIVKDNFFRTEPSYQGRRLSEWLVDVDWGQPQQKRDAAAKAIRKMGPKTVPFLLADLGDERFKNVHWSKLDNRTLGNRPRQATWGFDALGSEGKSAIPDLVKLLDKNPGYIPGALAGIGLDALPDLLSALTNDDFFVRDNTAAAIANALYEQKITPAQAQAAFPIALANLTYTSTNSLYGVSFQENTRWRAASLLGALHLNPDLSVPALIQGMNSPDATVATECAYSLGDFGKDAAPAVPALIQGLNGSNYVVAIACAMTLGNAELVNSATAAIPALIRGLGNTNSSVVLLCASALGNFSSRELGPNRTTVISALNEMANSTNPQLSQVARQSVKNIETRR